MGIERSQPSPLDCAFPLICLPLFTLEKASTLLVIVTPRALKILHFIAHHLLLSSSPPSNLRKLFNHMLFALLCDSPIVEIMEGVPHPNHDRHRHHSPTPPSDFFQGISPAHLIVLEDYRAERKPSKSEVLIGVLPQTSSHSS